MHIRSTICLAGVLLAGVSAATARQKSSQVQVEILPVPRGLKGLKFGMTPHQVKEALPGLLHVTELKPGRVWPSRKPEPAIPHEELEAMSVPLPGSGLQATTTIGSLTVSCEFWFVVRGGLSRIRCETEPFAGKHVHLEVRDEILRVLKGKYGPATKSEDRGEWSEFSYRDDQTWAWEDDVARLEFSSYLLSFSGTVASSRMEIVNESFEHLALNRKLHDEADRKLDEAVKQKAAEALRQRRVLEYHRRKLEQDL